MAGNAAREFLCKGRFCVSPGQSSSTGGVACIFSRIGAVFGSRVAFSAAPGFTRRISCQVTVHGPHYLPQGCSRGAIPATQRFMDGDSFRRVVCSAFFAAGPLAGRKHRLRAMGESPFRYGAVRRSHFLPIRHIMGWEIAFYGRNHGRVSHHSGSGPGGIRGEEIPFHRPGGPGAHRG